MPPEIPQEQVLKQLQEKFLRELGFEIEEVKKLTSKDLNLPGGVFKHHTFMKQAGGIMREGWDPSKGIPLHPLYEDLSMSSFAEPAGGRGNIHLAIGPKGWEGVGPTSSTGEELMDYYDYDEQEWKKKPRPASKKAIPVEFKIAKDANILVLDGANADDFWKKVNRLQGPNPPKYAPNSREIVKLAKSAGFDGVAFVNVYDMQHLGGARKVGETLGHDQLVISNTSKATPIKPDFGKAAKAKPMVPFGPRSSFIGPRPAIDTSPTPRGNPLWKIVPDNSDFAKRRVALFGEGNAIPLKANVGKGREAKLLVRPAGKLLVVEDITIPGTDRKAIRNAFGPRRIREMGRQLARMFPDQNWMTGLRVTGVRSTTRGFATEGPQPEVDLKKLRHEVPKGKDLPKWWYPAEPGANVLEEEGVKSTRALRRQGISIERGLRETEARITGEVPPRKRVVENPFASWKGKLKPPDKALKGKSTVRRIAVGGGVDERIARAVKSLDYKGAFRLQQAAAANAGKGVVAAEALKGTPYGAIAALAKRRFKETGRFNRPLDVMWKALNNKSSVYRKAPGVDKLYLSDYIQKPFSKIGDVSMVYTEVPRNRPSTLKRIPLTRRGAIDMLKEAIRQGKPVGNMGVIPKVGGKEANVQFANLIRGLRDIPRKDIRGYAKFAEEMGLMEKMTKAEFAAIPKFAAAYDDATVRMKSLASTLDEFSNQPVRLIPNFVEFGDEIIYSTEEVADFQDKEVRERRGREASKARRADAKSVRTERELDFKRGKGVRINMLPGEWSRMRAEQKAYSRMVQGGKAGLTAFEKANEQISPRGALYRMYVGANMQEVYQEVKAGKIPMRKAEFIAHLRAIEDTAKELERQLKSSEAKFGKEGKKFIPGLGPPEQSELRKILPRPPKPTKGMPVPTITNRGMPNLLTQSERRTILNRSLSRFRDLRKFKGGGTLALLLTMSVALAMGLADD